MTKEQSRIIEYRGKEIKMVLKGDYKFKNLDELESYVLEALDFGFKCEMFKHEDELHYHFYYL